MEEVEHTVGLQTCIPTDGEAKETAAALPHHPYWRRRSATSMDMSKTPQHIIHGRMALPITSPLSTSPQIRGGITLEPIKNPGSILPRITSPGNTQSPNIENGSIFHQVTTLWTTTLPRSNRKCTHTPITRPRVIICPITKPMSILPLITSQRSISPHMQNKTVHPPTTTPESMYLPIANHTSMSTPITNRARPLPIIQLVNPV